MIAVDSSTLITYIQGEPGADVDQFDAALAAGTAVLPPAVLAEVLSQPSLPQQHIDMLVTLPMIALADGYWLRVANSRERLIRLKLKAYLADALIAQACIDADVPLITRDRDFRHFEKHCGLKLV